MTDQLIADIRSRLTAAESRRAQEDIRIALLRELLAGVDDGQPVLAAAPKSARRAGTKAGSAVAGEATLVEPAPGSQNEANGVVQIHGEGPVMEQVHDGEGLFG